MDGRGGCCIARYAGNPYEKSKVDRILLRYRPIAPKPVVGRDGTGGVTPDNKEGVFRGGRTKRKYVRDGNNKRCRRKRRVLSEEKKDGMEESGHDAPTATAVTLLPLLPEIPDRKEIPARKQPFEFDLDLKVKPDSVVVMRQPVRPVGSFVTVERVTEAYVGGGEGLGSTDEERKKSLEMDTCPGFISDGLNKVEWTNEAYRKMIGEREARPEMVWLMTKEKLPMTSPAFACPVRLQYTCLNERHSLTVPCDVWRMDGGGFAWRLDVKAALSLGR